MACQSGGSIPEPSRAKRRGQTGGHADVRVLEALKTGGAVKLPPFTRTRRIDTQAQKVELRAVSTPELVNASNTGEGVDKLPKN